MRTSILLIVAVASLSLTGCKYFSQRLNKEEPVVIDYNDPEFTGVKPYYEEGHLVREASYVGGVRNGPTTTYYRGTDRIRQIINYRNGLRHDTAKWFYEDGHLFRITPYVNDTIHGTQIQYYRSGRPRTKIHFENGLREARLEEFHDGRGKIERDVNITYRVVDDYEEGYIYTIHATIDHPSYRVTFYRGGLADGRLFDPNRVQRIYMSDRTATIQLHRSRGTNRGYIDIIAEYITPFANRDYIHKRIPLPYRDMN